MNVKLFRGIMTTWDSEQGSCGYTVEKVTEMDVDVRPVQGDTLVTRQNEVYTVKKVVIRENEEQEDDILVRVKSSEDDTFLENISDSL